MKTKPTYLEALEILRNSCDHTYPCNCDNREVTIDQAIALYKEFEGVERKEVESEERTRLGYILLNKCPCEDANCDSCKRLYEALEEQDKISQHPNNKLTDITEEELKELDTTEPVIRVNNK